MTSIPKPKHCRQNWLDMSPANGGRLCAQCNKVIVDLSKKNWAEIEALQKQHNNTLCGMYSPKQLDHWGHEIPSARNTLTKAAVTTGLLVSLAAAAHAQSNNQTDSMLVKGKVTDVDSGKPIGYTSIWLSINNVYTNVHAVTDTSGNFELTVPVPLTGSLRVSCVGYETNIINADSLTDVRQFDKRLQNDDGTLTIAIRATTSDIEYYYVTRPTFFQKVKKVFEKP